MVGTQRGVDVGRAGRELSHVHGLGGARRTRYYMQLTPGYIFVEYISYISYLRWAPAPATDGSSGRQPQRIAHVRREACP